MRRDYLNALANSTTGITGRLKSDVVVAGNVVVEWNGFETRHYIRLAPLKEHMKRGELLLEIGSSRVSSRFLSREAFVCPLLNGCLFGGPAKGAGHTATGRGGRRRI